MFVETVDLRLVFDQDLYCFFSCEFYCLACWYLCAHIINVFWLLLWVERRIETEVVLAVDEVPAELDTIVHFFVQGIVSNSEERTLDSGHKSTSSSNWLTGAESSWRFYTKALFNDMNKGRYSGSSSNKFDTVQVDFLLLDSILHSLHNFSNGGEDGLTDLLELLSFHVVPEIFLFHEIFDVELVLSDTCQNFSLFLDVLHHL